MFGLLGFLFHLLAGPKDAAEAVVASPRQTSNVLESISGEGQRRSGVLYRVGVQIRMVMEGKGKGGFGRRIPEDGVGRQQDVRRRPGLQ